MNTELMLFARYEKPYVRLEDVCEELFNLCERKAKEAAASQKLPVPVLRMTESRKSPMMIKLSDLADYLDSRHEEYTKTWEKVKNLVLESVDIHAAHSFIPVTVELCKST